jgi:hypothetical protein
MREGIEANFDERLNKPQKVAKKTLPHHTDTTASCFRRHRVHQSKQISGHCTHDNPSR